MNFAGLVKIVDALGGVDIESDANFSCVPRETPDGNGDYTYQKYSFTKGINHVQRLTRSPSPVSARPLPMGITAAVSIR